jgi:hypothetical protein
MRLDRFILAPALDNGCLHLVARGLEIEPALCHRFLGIRPWLEGSWSCAYRTAGARRAEADIMPPSISKHSRHDTAN